MSSRKKVLILDDESEFAQYVVRVAQGLGYETRATTSSKAFKQAYAQEKPDTVVLDIIMPEEDGIEVVRWLESQGYESHIIVISGYSPRYLRAARVLGEQSGRMKITQLQKPTKLADLRAALHAGPTRL